MTTACFATMVRFRDGNAQSVVAPASPEPTPVPRKGGASLMPICSDSTRSRSIRTGNTLAPARHGADEPTSVYKYFDSLGILIYVGITKQSVARNAQHNLTKAWWHHVTSQQIIHCSSRSEALEMERQLIASHCPPFNKQGNQNESAALAAYEDLLTHANADVDQLLMDSKSEPAATVASVDCRTRTIHLVVLPKYFALMRGVGLSHTFKVVNYYAAILSRSVVEISQFGSFHKITVKVNFRAIGNLRNRHRVGRVFFRRRAKDSLIEIEKIQILESWAESHIPPQSSDKAVTHE